MTMPLFADTPASDPSETFQELVRDALLHLYDPAHLQTHPLLPLASAAASGVPRSRLLRQELLDAIESLRPATGVAASAPAWRVYNILELRYIEGLDVSDVLDHIALSKSQYHREHQRALQAVASLLWEPRRPSAAHAARPAPSDLARTEARRLHCDEGDVVIDPLEALQGVQRLLEPLYQRLGVALRVMGPARLPAIPGDRVALRQALLTFLTGAVEGGAPGAVTVDATAAMDEIIFDVTGTGAPAATAWPRTAASRPFVEALRGRLDAPPPLDDGRWRARFRFPTVRQHVLMVVDNSTDFIELVARYVAHRGWQVIGVSDVTQAALLARRQRPRAVLLDVVIPGRDGWDLLMELKTADETRAIPVIICSVLNEPSIAISLGAAAYLCKPIDQHQLLATLAALGTSPPAPPLEGRGARGGGSGLREER